MENEKETIQRKLDTAKASLTALEAELIALEGQVGPLNARIATAQKSRQYLRERIEKLTKILKG